MNGEDPMLGSADEQRQYVAGIMNMIQKDVEERRAQRLEEFRQSSSGGRAVIQGSSGNPDSVVLSIPQGDQS